MNPVESARERAREYEQDEPQVVRDRRALAELRMAVEPRGEHTMKPDDSLPDRLSIRWTPPDARPCKFIFEKRADGGWDRTERRWDGQMWVYVGSEIVASLELEGLPVAESQTGP